MPRQPRREGSPDGGGEDRPGAEPVTARISHEDPTGQMRDPQRAASLRARWFPFGDGARVETLPKGAVSPDRGHCPPWIPLCRIARKKKKGPTWVWSCSSCFS